MNTTHLDLPDWLIEGARVPCLTFPDSVTWVTVTHIADTHIAATTQDRPGSEVRFSRILRADKETGFRQLGTHYGTWLVHPDHPKAVRPAAG